MTVGQPANSPASGAARPARAPLARLVPGLALSVLLALAAVMLSRLDWIRNHGLSALALAIALGMLVGNTAYPRIATTAGPGVDLAKQKLLRIGIVLYGLRLTLQDIDHVGIAGVLIDACVVASTFLVACVIGPRWFGVERQTAMLVGIGGSICGAAAVMAAEPVVRARDDQAAVAIATVVLFGTIAIFVYPLLYQLNAAWPVIPGGADRFGIYVGSTIHEVAQVVAAGRSISPGAADLAVITKMVRVLMLAPFLIGLSVWLERGVRATPAQSSGPRPPAIPWFAVAFAGVVLFNSLHWLPSSTVAATVEFDTWLLAAAMAALGLSTRVAAIRRAGMGPLLLALALFAWLVVGGALINRWIPALVGV